MNFQQMMGEWREVLGFVTQVTFRFAKEANTQQVSGKAVVRLIHRLEHFHFWSIYSEKGVRYQKCEAPEGPFRLLVPDPVFRAYVVPKNALGSKVDIVIDCTTNSKALDVNAKPL
jgi:hypothetical protein